MQPSNAAEIWLWGFVLVAICALFWMLMMFGDLPIAVSKIRSFEVLISFPSASGVGRDTPVQYCGYQIGRVLNVSPPMLVKDKDGTPISHRVKVACLIEEKFVDIPSNVEVKLMRRGLGSSYIEFVWNPNIPLEPKDPSNPRSIFLMDQMELAGTTGMSSEFFPPDVQKKLENLVDSISELSANANQIIGNEDNQANIRKTWPHQSSHSQAKDTLLSIQNFTDVGKEQIVGGRPTGYCATEFNYLTAQINQDRGQLADLFRMTVSMKTLWTAQPVQLALGRSKFGPLRQEIGGSE